MARRQGTKNVVRTDATERESLRELLGVLDVGRGSLEPPARTAPGTKAATIYLADDEAEWFEHEAEQCGLSLSRYGLAVLRGHRRRMLEHRGEYEEPMDAFSEMEKMLRVLWREIIETADKKRRGELESKLDAMERTFDRLREDA